MQAKNHIAPTIRAAVMRGLELAGERKGKTFSEMVADEIESKGLLAVLQVASKFVERDHRHEMAVKVQHSSDGLPETARWLAEVVGAATVDALPEPSEERPLLPH